MRNVFGMFRLAEQKYSKVPSMPSKRRVSCAFIPRFYHRSFFSARTGEDTFAIGLQVGSGRVCVCQTIFSCREKDAWAMGRGMPRPYYSCDPVTTLPFNIIAPSPFILPTSSAEMRCCSRLGRERLGCRGGRATTLGGAEREPAGKGSGQPLCQSCERGVAG